MTMQVADDDASVAWELLRVVSVLRSKLVESNVRREQLMDGVGHIVGLPQRDDQEPPTTNVADHRTTSTAARSACFWSRLRRSRQRRAGAGRLRNKTVGAA